MHTEAKEIQSGAEEALNPSYELCPVEETSILQTSLLTFLCVQGQIEQISLCYFLCDI